MQIRMFALDSEGGEICVGTMLSPMPRSVFDNSTERIIDSLVNAAKGSLNKEVLPFVHTIILIDQEKALEQAKEM